MLRWKHVWLGLALAATWPAAGRTQPPPAPAAPEPQTLWGWLGLSKKNKADCKEKICKSPLGQMLGGITKPASALSGGIIPGPCDTPSAKDLAKKTDDYPASRTSAEGAAARIKESEANAKARRAAVRYLGTVDCRWYPEARDALTDALLNDPNECVRYEAALALARGCCCDEIVIAKLKVCIEGVKDESGKLVKPPDNSERVREAAVEALNHCLAKHPEKKPDIPPPPEEIGDHGVRPAGYSARSNRGYEVDRRGRLPAGERSLTGIFKHAFGSRTVSRREVDDRPVVHPPATELVEPKIDEPLPPKAPPVRPGVSPVPHPVPEDDFPGIIELPVRPDVELPPARPEVEPLPEAIVPMPVEVPLVDPPVETPEVESLPLPILPIEGPAPVVEPAHRIPTEPDENVVPVLLKVENHAPTAAPAATPISKQAQGKNKKPATGKRGLLNVISNAFQRNR